MTFEQYIFGAVILGNFAFTFLAYQKLSKLEKNLAYLYGLLRKELPNGTQD